MMEGLGMPEHFQKVFWSGYLDTNIHLEMGGNQLQIFNGILLKVAAVTIEPEEPGGGAIATAASGGIMGQCSAVIEAARGALADALAGGAVSSKAK